MIRKKIQTIIIACFMLLSVLAIIPSVQAGQFHIIKGTLYVDDVVMGEGAQIRINILTDTFYNDTFDPDPNGYTFYLGAFDNDQYYNAIAYLTVLYNDSWYIPIDNASVLLNKNTNPTVENYIIDLHINESNPVNNPPNTPSNPNPSQGSTNVAISKTLSWTGGDPDGDDVTYDVYFGTISPPPMKSTNQTGTSYNPGTLDYNTNYYWQIISWDEHGASSEGPIWNFKTRSEPSDGPDPDPDPDFGPVTPINQPPVAIATVDKYTGVPAEVFTFDASDSSDPDGEIVEYRWDFDDGITENTDQTMITHAFTSVGSYNVMLTVQDNQGATGSLVEPIIIEIIFANFPPENLRVTPGTTWTHKNTDVTFTMSATDPDINDTIRFSIDWGDGTNLVSDHLFESGSDFETSHQWETFGLYPVEVTAFDEANASSETVTTTMYVDVLVIDDVITGWLIDLNSNETFDVFRDTVTKEETNLSKYNESTYLIDADGDGEWDYLYNIDTETLTVYTTETPDDDDLSYVAILILVGLILLLFIIFAYIAYKNKKERKRREQQKKQEKEQKKKKPEEKKTSSSSKGKKRSSKKKNK